MRLPGGVVLRELNAHTDHRGTLTEGYRQSVTTAPLKQFNVVVSAAGVLRGVHLHVDHTDHLVMAHGRLVVGLHDCRRSSATFGTGTAVVLQDNNRSLTIPPGVAHGFWTPTGGTLVYALDVEWSPDDELGCRWDDPGLAIDWSTHGDVAPGQFPGGPLLSERDRTALSLEAMIERFDAALLATDPAAEPAKEPSAASTHR